MKTISYPPFLFHLIQCGRVDGRTDGRAVASRRDVNNNSHNVIAPSLMQCGEYIHRPKRTRERERERKRERALIRSALLLLGIYIYIRYVAATGVVLISKGFSFFFFVILKQEAKRNLLLFVDLLSSVLPIPSHCHPPNKQQSQQY